MSKPKSLYESVISRYTSKNESGGFCFTVIWGLKPNTGSAAETDGTCMAIVMKPASRKKSIATAIILLFNFLLSPYCLLLNSERRALFKNSGS